MSSLEIKTLDEQHHDFPEGRDWYNAHWQRSRILNTYLFNSGIMLSDAGYGLRVKVAGENKYEIHPFVRNNSSMPWVPDEYEWGVTQDVADDTGKDWIPLAVGYSEADGKRKLHVDVGAGEMSRTSSRGEGASISDSGHLRLCFFQFERQYFIDLDEHGRCGLDDAPHDFYFLHTMPLGDRQYMKHGGVRSQTIDRIFRDRNPMHQFEKRFGKPVEKEPVPWLDNHMYGGDLRATSGRIGAMNPYELFLRFTLGYRKGSQEKIVNAEAGLYLGGLRYEQHEKYEVMDLKFDAILFRTNRKGVSPTIERIGYFDPDAVNKAQNYHGVEFATAESEWGAFFAENQEAIPVASEGRDFTLAELVRSREMIRQHVLLMLPESTRQGIVERVIEKTEAQRMSEELRRMGGLDELK